MVRALMDITFIRSHSSSSSGRLGASLEAALHKHGHRVTLLSPLPAGADPAAMSLALRLVKVELEHGGSAHTFDVYTGRDSDGVELAYLGGVHLEELPDADALFGAAAARYLLETDGVSDVVVGAGAAGARALEALEKAGEPAARVLLTEGESHEQAALLAAEVLFAGSDEELDSLLDRLGDARDDRPARVLTLGPDPTEWNPLTDPHLASRFDPLDLRGKAKCKASLQRELALPVRPDVPLVGVVGRGDEGGGIEILSRIGTDVLKNDAQLVVHVEGGGEVIGVLEDLWERFPDRLQIRTGRDEAFIHRLLGACDALLVPVEAGDDTALALAAQRYGALPIVSRRSNVAQVIVDVDPSLETGSGFLTGGNTEEELLAALRRVVAAFESPEAFGALAQRAMRQDRTVDSMVALFEYLAEAALEKKAGPAEGDEEEP